MSLIEIKNTKRIHTVTWDDPKISTCMIFSTKIACHAWTMLNRDLPIF